MNGAEVREVADVLEADWGMSALAERLRAASKDDHSPPEGSKRPEVRAWARHRILVARTLTVQAVRALERDGDEQTADVVERAIDPLTEGLAATHDGEGEMFACKR